MSEPIAYDDMNLSMIEQIYGEIKFIHEVLKNHQKIFDFYMNEVKNQVIDIRATMDKYHDAKPKRKKRANDKADTRKKAGNGIKRKRTGSKKKTKASHTA